MVASVVATPASPARRWRALCQGVACVATWITTVDWCFFAGVAPPAAAICPDPEK